jgi:Zn-dependent peptidase ImmA (M78 family)
MLDANKENHIIATVSYIHQRTGFHEPPFSLQNFFNQFPGFKVIAARLPAGFDGELLIRGNDKIIRYRVESRDQSTRFTIAHEIAHCFLHHRENYHCRVNKRFRIYEAESAAPKETEADFFALELLVPLPLLNRIVRPLEHLNEKEIGSLASELAQLFGINTITMKSRLKDLAIYRKFDEAEWL